MATRPLYLRPPVLAGIALAVGLAVWFAPWTWRPGGHRVGPADVQGAWRFDETAYAQLVQRLLGPATGSANPLLGYGQALAGTTIEFTPASCTITRAGTARTTACTYDATADDTLAVQPDAAQVASPPGARSLPPGFAAAADPLAPGARLTLVVDAATGRLTVRSAVFAFPFQRIR